jgi:hypothetical protein
MRRAWLLLIGTLALTVPAGCGDDDGSGDETSASEQAAADGGLLFTLTSSGGTLEPVAGKDDTFTLTLTDTAPRVSSFSDRPVRSADTEPVTEFVDAWPGRGFDEDPPNAALVLDEEAADADTAVYVISDPSYDAGAGTLSYTAAHVDGNDGGGALPQHENDDPPAKFGSAHLFVDPSESGQQVDLALTVNQHAGAQTQLTFDSAYQPIMGTPQQGVSWASVNEGGGVVTVTVLSQTSSGDGDATLSGSGPAITGTARVGGGGHATVSVNEGPEIPVKTGPFSFPVD